MTADQILVRHRALMVGDRAPDFTLPDDTGTGRTLSNEVRGRPIVLCFPDHGTDGAWLEQMRASARAFSPLFLTVLATRDDHGAWGGDCEAHDEILLTDPAGRIRTHYFENAGVAPPVAFVLDPNQRITAIHNGADAPRGLAEALAMVSPSQSPRTISGQAPVLIVPNVLQREACEVLIEAWRTGEQTEGMVTWLSDEGGGLKVNHETKRRQDCIISDQGLGNVLRNTLGPRLAEETYRAFHFSEFALETFKIGCYRAANNGFFKAHRDNVVEATKRRCYAVTINLNADNYEGGDLRFPEYGTESYRPPTGAAIIFSCSLLHEVTPVSSGERYTLLTFLLKRQHAPTAKGA